MHRTGNKRCTKSVGAATVEKLTVYCLEGVLYV
jgi:hypothetical protein